MGVYVRGSQLPLRSKHLAMKNKSGATGVPLRFSSEDQVKSEIFGTFPRTGQSVEPWGRYTSHAITGCTWPPDTELGVTGFEGQSPCLIFFLIVIFTFCPLL